MNNSGSESRPKLYSQLVPKTGCPKSRDQDPHAAPGVVHKWVLSVLHRCPFPFHVPHHLQCSVLFVWPDPYHCHLLLVLPSTSDSVTSPWTFGPVCHPATDVLWVHTSTLTVTPCPLGSSLLCTTFPGVPPRPHLLHPLTREFLWEPEKDRIIIC